ncbi:nitrate reductase cytochrome c-type subunit [Rhodoblastus acidophilus]|uniref:nitrate reductase cytochrome c-type subunit n=1 Tax=Rhodoblastus acidophilus TaxID=1074 RepID=UPI002224F3CF|nr:nitrate reductase cytochrome c-type subunit [Rhodoblastus acidophilus]MCW2285100.1 nitrate reductase cytochrome c-type subunit [Rhodoblastus acidophilus]MCW2334042.1 nitrate reductase cytochrome c-type subunit [Rhodoblastus acidophilus]
MSVNFKSNFVRAAAAALLLFSLPAAAADGSEAAAPAEPTPPLVPHTTADHKITRDRNDCLTCHQPPANEMAGAKAVSDSHYVHRNGERLDKILPTRGFCTQCHTPAPDAKPLPGGKS